MREDVLFKIREEVSLNSWVKALKNSLGYIKEVNYEMEEINFFNKSE